MIKKTRTMEINTWARTTRYGEKDVQRIAKSNTEENQG